MSESNNINNNYVDGVYQPEDYFDNINHNPPIQMPINPQAQSQAQHFRPHATSFPLHGNVDINIIDYGNNENIISYQSNPSVSYYYPGVDTSMNGPLNTPFRNQVASYENSFCPLCGFSNGYFDRIDRSITHTFTQNSNVMNESTSREYTVIREVRIQFVLGTLPATASFDEVLALIQK
ncbi:3817_t:CDS:1 [Paraglomus occultum]|uniref:3817_t:CDS:1 n=1 Tax=Paraglomus occultum TaxID=144539 RepID=A0A9N9AZY0_9GLOM|nr:3817_t:CDS:1 [Paraglomus occultum]